MAATYGKKKSILPSFSVLRDSTSTFGSKKDKTKKRLSTSHSAATVQSNGPLIANHSRYDDSIEEMASMLLEDTNIDQVRNEHGKRLSQVASEKVAPRISSTGLRQSKTLSQLPQLQFIGDDAWAMKHTPLGTAAGCSNEVNFLDDDSVEAGNPTSNSHKTLNQLRQDLIPVIPRRSSKRKSARPVSHVHTRSPVKYRTSISSPKPKLVASTGGSTVDAGSKVNQQIEAMLAATNALKPGHNSAILQNSYVPMKKRRLKDNKVLSKVKSAINDRLQARNVKKKHESIRDGLRLDISSAMNPMTDDTCASSSALSSVERRLNEGSNLKNPKIYSLTGHGQVRRKQLADDGKSLRSRKSFSDDPFSSRPGSSGISRTPTSFENRLNEEMPIDQETRHIPGRPSQSYGDELPQPRSKKARKSYASTDPYLDSFFSSSPVAQSTPRIRLEPAFEEDGKTTLKNVPAKSRSVFDPDNSSIGHNSDMEIDSPLVVQVQSRRRSGGKRKSLQLRDSYVPTISRGSQRMKKHPSPSKAELEVLEQAWLKLNESGIFGNGDDVTMSGTDTPLASGVLTNLDTNTKLTEPSRRERGKGSGMLLKPDLMRTSASMPKIHKAGPSKIPKPGDSFISRVRRGSRGEHRFSKPDGMDGGSLMDVDELQGDQTALMRT